MNSIPPPIPPEASKSRHVDHLGGQVIAKQNNLIISGPILWVIASIACTTMMMGSSLFIFWCGKKLGAW